MKTVLVVDDSNTDRRLIAALLEKDGYHPVPLDSAEAAQTWLETNQPPDLVLLDIVMPGLSGLDVCRYIRDHPKLSAIPIIFCTSKDKEFDQFWAMRQGGNAYITKPFLPNQLLETVQQQLN